MKGRASAAVPGEGGARGAATALEPRNTGGVHPVAADTMRDLLPPIRAAGQARDKDGTAAGETLTPHGMPRRSPYRSISRPPKVKLFRRK
ncbi:MAG: hypothetical protein AcusKO_00350 [Acuticoccus sp.]